jgi:hypothetical protein
VKVNWRARQFALPRFPQGELLADRIARFAGGG